ncbi:NAD-dependent epimerase/dehydratase family protein [Salipaludibacillus sp. LMS25]|jgi:uncharacterized protein YbjT (DUF2867 family)|uniref:NAD-dependent epimerase/dehydratase family protein n=1 Tax=Salipaludibacillus sp. LMS25 TaxID=2924031 RepID=UPI0020D0770C|nr:NAD-dependent epimerase/dehydratase family protein [Salipaludibacillus sp. LMS25]UTR16335.1 NAD-dependent epimerase/dehydratase family protein [Salipaludibacillus sp. LMS25]
MKRAIVAGATGLIGSHLVEKMLEGNDYEEIHIISRRRTPFARHLKVREHVTSFEQLEKAVYMIEPGDDVFVTLGTTMKKVRSKRIFTDVDYRYPLTLAQLAKEHGAARFLIVTAMGAHPDSLFFYSRVKGKLEDKLITLDLPSLHIFRPSLLIGERNDWRAGEKLAELVFKPLSILFTGTLEKYQPIKGLDVAVAMLAVAQKKSDGVHIFESDQIKRLGKSDLS